MITSTPVVTEIGKLFLSGNVIPNEWFQEPSFRYPSGAVNLLAIVILSEIIYWYRPTEVRDEHTGHTLGWKKKFHADKLQRSYEELSTKFGCSKRQAAEACHFLRDAGLITLEFRMVKKQTAGGGCLTLNNVLFIEPVVGKIVTTIQTPLSHSNVIPSHVQTSYPPTPERDTNTKTTAETTTESKSVLANAVKGVPMKAEDVLKAHATKKLAKPVEKIALHILWKSKMSALYGGYQKPLLVKELGQLSQLSKKLGGEGGKVLSFALDNWKKFAAKAQQAAGLNQHPSVPNIGFLLMYYEHAVNMMQSIAPAPPVEDLPNVEAHGTVAVAFDKKNILGEGDYVPYKPSADELEKLFEGLNQ